MITRIFGNKYSAYINILAIFIVGGCTAAGWISPDVATTILVALGITAGVSQSPLNK